MIASGQVYEPIRSLCWLKFAFNAFFNGEYNYPAATLSIMFLFLILGKEDKFECLE